MDILLLAAALAASLPQTPLPADTATATASPAGRTATASVILPYAIDSDPPADLDLDGLVDSEATDRGAPNASGRRSPARQANDEALDQAFEEAADMARFGRPD
jgi:hypothetical protein